MPKVELEHGMFGWCDLATHDVAAAAAFYQGLFGWQAKSVEHEGHVVYHMFTLDGANVAGLVDNRGWGSGGDGPPPMWVSYIIVDDVDALAPRVEELGGTVLRPPMNVMESGRMAFIQDPTGAMVGVWEPGEHLGADVFNEAGTLTWNELVTRDVEGACAFYDALLGWGWEVTEMASTGPYHMGTVGGRPTAGIMEMPPDMEDVPANWVVYFHVDDIDGAVERAGELGGTLVWGPEGAEVGTFAVMADPTGGHFSLFRPAGRG
jgi:hypothetical protein